MSSADRPATNIIIPRRELDKLQFWATWARQQGILQDYLAEIKTVRFRLGPSEAREWGEPKYPLKSLKLYMRFGQTQMFNVWYAVHDELPTVFVKLFQFRTDYPKGQPPESA